MSRRLMRVTKAMRMAGKGLVATLRILVGSASCASVLATLTLARYSHAQSNAPVTYSENVEYVGPSQSDTQIAEGDDPDAPKDDVEQLPETALDTGLPLKVLVTPFHWGRFSLLSVTSYQGYNTNPNFRESAAGASVTSVSALAMYSSAFAGWRLNMQYQPFLWVSSGRTLKDFAAASADLRTLQPINATWHWTLGESFRYAPTHSSAQGKGFVSDPGGGVSFGDVFLSSGRNVLVNVLAGTLTDRYSEHSMVTFHLNQDVTHLSSFVGRLSGGPDTSSQTAVNYSTGVTWRKRLTPSDTISIAYRDRLQSSTGRLAVVNSQTASIGWSHKLESGFGISANFGPAWSNYFGTNANSSGHGHATMHGSLALSKQFRHMGVVASVARSNEFTGIFSDHFHNRADLSIQREFSSRLSASVAASYVEQQFRTEQSAKGKLATAEARYRMSRNWSIFSQARYLRINGGDTLMAPEKNVVVGFRWSWVPEKP